MPVVGATGATVSNENNDLTPRLGNNPAIENIGETTPTPERLSPSDFRLAEARHKAQATHLSRLERLALLGLEGSSVEEFYFTFARISRKGLPRPQVRRAVRSLARKGLAAYSRALMNEDGGLAGAGYALTLAGGEALALLKEREGEE